MTVDRYQGFLFDPTVLAEDVDLDVERRKEILFTAAHLTRWTHWEVLGIPWNAPSSVARAAYLEEVKVFHPDCYGGRRLGTYRPRLERVFRRITEARDLLSDEGKRAGYAKETAPPEEFAKIEARRLDDERRGAERRQRIAQKNPLFARAGRVAELVGRGKDSLAQGRLAQAANDLLLAASLDPQNAEVVALAAEAKRRASAAKANELFDKGAAAEAMGMWGAALAAHCEALAADPRNVRAAVHGARCALAQGDAGQARELADQAVRAGPGVGAAHEALGLVLEAQGEKKEARLELERALELDPKLAAAKERLKKLRWGFLG